MTDKATPSPASADSVMAKAMMLVGALDDSCEEATSLPFLEAVTALRAEVERLAAQAAPTEPTVPLAKSRVGRVYLAGPMTGYENFNFSAFNAAAQRLRAEGFDVVNPADHGIVDGAEWADYLRFDLGKLAQCESIALLPGWEVSKGANLEVSVAQKLGIVVRCLDGAAQPSQAPVVQALQARGYPPLPEWAKRDDLGDLVPSEIRAALHAYVDADRASSGATTQAVRMLTREELNDVALSEQVGWGPGEYVEAVQLALLRVNAGRTIPADGVIGGAA